MRNPQKLRDLFGVGMLGKLFPSIFGAEQGIVGRSQGGGHEFTLDEHIARVVESIAQDPLLSELSSKEQTDLLLVGLRRSWYVRL